jgi:hypothetical protein
MVEGAQSGLPTASGEKRFRRGKHQIGVPPRHF